MHGKPLPRHVSAVLARESGTEASQKPTYDSVAVPVLIIEGGRDKLKPAGWAKEFANDIPGATSAVIEIAGHCPQIEQPDDFHRLLMAFAND